MISPSNTYIGDEHLSVSAAYSNANYDDFNVVYQGAVFGQYNPYINIYNNTLGSTSRVGNVPNTPIVHGTVEPSILATNTGLEAIYTDLYSSTINRHIVPFNNSCPNVWRSYALTDQNTGTSRIQTVTTPAPLNGCTKIGRVSADYNFKGNGYYSYINYDLSNLYRTGYLMLYRTGSNTTAQIDGDYINGQTLKVTYNLANSGQNVYLCYVQSRITSGVNGSFYNVIRFAKSSAANLDAGGNFTFRDIAVPSRFNQGLYPSYADYYHNSLPNSYGYYLNDNPSMDVDQGSTYRGRIYVVYPEANPQDPTKSVIRLKVSSDEGATFSAPITISSPNAAICWSPNISVDPTTGGVHVLYYAIDNSNLGALQADVYTAYSADGGTSFVQTKVNAASHQPSGVYASSSVNNGCQFPYTEYANPQYISVIANNGRASFFWSDNRSGHYRIRTNTAVYRGITMDPAGFYYVRDYSAGCSSNPLACAPNADWELHDYTTNTTTVLATNSTTCYPPNFWINHPTVMRAKLRNSSGALTGQVLVLKWVDCYNSGGEFKKASAAAPTPAPADYLYPNPNNGTFSVDFSSLKTTAPIKVAVVNQMGQVVYTADAVPGQNRVALPRIPNGIYQLIATYDNQKVTQKFVVSH